MNLRDTIVAISTPVGRGGLGVVRLSGPNSCSVAGQILRFQKNHEWRSWCCSRADLLDEDGRLVDQTVVSFFEAPRSYTAEDVVEISCHGAPVVLRFCLGRALQFGARLAEPGEFTLRAYLNGRLDLLQAEAVRDLIDATTLYQARVAVQQAEGSVSRRIRPIKDSLLELIALLEAGIDFAEDDISVATPDEVLRRIAGTERDLRTLLDTFSAGRLVFQGFTLAIAGRPNVGKSSLFNRLLEQDRAIVTDVPGTTRDLISEATAIGGIPVKLVDTAGIRAGQDAIETLGIERSFQAIADADLTILVLDGSHDLTPEDETLLDKLRDRKPLLVANKLDLGPRLPATLQAIPVSAISGQGIDHLRESLFARLAPDGLASPESGSITNLRQQALLAESLEALQNARRAVEFNIPHEMLLLDLYAALQPVDALTGATTADDILNRIFSTFCIGK